MNGRSVRLYAWHGQEVEPPPDYSHHPWLIVHRRECEPCRWAFNLWQRCKRRGGYRQIVGNQ